MKSNAGTIGLFYAGNEISAIISILAPVCFAILISQKFNIINALLCAITVFAMLEIGTKVAFVSIVRINNISINYFIHKIDKKRK